MKTERMVRVLVMLSVILGVGILWIKADDAGEGLPEFTEEDLFFEVWLDYSELYDADTIKDVLIDVADFKMRYPPAMLFPGVYLHGEDLYLLYDIRIAGVDTPEKRPATAGRTEASRSAEKAAAALATAALAGLFEEYGTQFRIKNPELGKYAGRIVAEVWVGAGEDAINVADWLILHGHGYAYTGETKRDFDEWYKGVK